MQCRQIFIHDLSLKAYIIAKKIIYLPHETKKLSAYGKKKENKLTTTKGIKRSLFYIFLQSFIILISPL